MSWRPKNWENKNPCIECPKKVEDEYGLFCDLACGLFTKFVYKEAGADAMLEALKQKGKYWDCPQGMIQYKDNLYPVTVPVVDVKVSKGWLVFIEDDVS